MFLTLACSSQSHRSEPRVARRWVRVGSALVAEVSFVSVQFVIFDKELKATFAWKPVGTVVSLLVALNAFHLEATFRCIFEMPFKRFTHLFYSWHIIAPMQTLSSVTRELKVPTKIYVLIFSSIYRTIVVITINNNLQGIINNKSNKLNRGCKKVE